MSQEFHTTSTPAHPRSPAETPQSGSQSKQGAKHLRDQAAEAGQAARKELGATAERLRGATADAANRARESAESFVGRQKDAAATEITHICDAMQRAAEKLHEEEDHRLASYAEAAANRARSAADYLKQHEVSDFFTDMQTTARRHPAAFFGGMFAAGVAMARFLKASPPAPRGAGSHDGFETSPGMRSPRMPTTTKTTSTRTTT